MEIQKIFSNIEDPEENLYSVLMSEDEVALFKEFSDKMSDEEYKAANKKVSKDASKATAGIGTAAVGTLASVGLASDALENHRVAKYLARRAKEMRGSMEFSKEYRHGFAKSASEKSRELAKIAKRRGAASIATGAAAIGGLTYAGKKLHDIYKQEKDPRFSKRLQEDLDKNKKH